jgi:hypothetical protein
MTFRGLLVVVAASALGACAGSKPSTDPGEDDFFTMKFADAAPVVAAASTDDASKTDAYTIEFSFERRDGRRLAGPSVTVYASQSASITMADQPPDGAAEVAGRPPEGMWLDACPKPTGDGGVSLGYRVRLAKLRAPAESSGDGAAAVPRDREVVEFEGARRMEPRAQGLLARVTSPDGSGPLLVLARVTPIRVPAPPQGFVDVVAPDAKLSRAASGRVLHLRVTAVAVPRPFEPGTVVDETATPDVMKPMGGRILRDFELYTCVDSRVRIAGLLESGDKKNGLVAEGRDDGAVDLSWTTNGVARTATIRPSAGHRFVALAQIDGGGTAGVLVAVDAD